MLRRRMRALLSLGLSLLIILSNAVPASAGESVRVSSQTLAARTYDAGETAGRFSAVVDTQADGITLEHLRETVATYKASEAYRNVVDGDRGFRRVDPLDFGGFTGEKRFLPSIANKQKAVLDRRATEQDKCVLCVLDPDEVIVDFEETELKLPYMLTCIKFPFMKDHMMLVPKEHQEKTLMDAMRFLLQIIRATRYAGVINVRGSGGSIPGHWHAKMFDEDTPLMLLRRTPLLTDNGVTVSEVREYGRAVFVVEGADEHKKLAYLETLIAAVGERGYAYNLSIDRDGAIFFIPRKKEFSDVLQRTVGGEQLSGVAVVNARGVTDGNVDTIVAILADRYMNLSGETQQAAVQEVTFSFEEVPFVYDALGVVSGKLVVPATITDHARALARALSESKLVPERAVRDIFLQLGREFISSEGQIVFESVNAFYDTLRFDNGAREGLLNDSNEIAQKYISEVSFVKGVLPAGQFYCDMYDPLNRRFLSLMDLVDGKMSEFDFLRRDLPDYDFLHIYDTGDDAYVLRRNNDEVLRRQFKEYAERTGEWQRIVEGELISGFEQKVYPVASAKLTSSIDERRHLLTAFSERQAIALCLGNPIPVSLWNCLDLFFERDDHDYLNCIRDLIIGIDEPLYHTKSCATDIIENFRVNYLLQLLERGPLRMDAILQLVFSEVASTMPGRPRHDASTGLVAFARRHWEKTVREALLLGVIVEREGSYEIVPKGVNRLDQVRIVRAAVIESGVLSPSLVASVRSELTGIYSHGKGTVKELSLCHAA